MPDSGFNIGAVRLDNPLILAPLAGVTNLPFRLLAKEQGAAMAVTEMVSAVGLAHRGPRTMKLLTTTALESPFCVQLSGRRPEYMAQAAVIAQEAGADVIDLNLGCPARKVVRHGSGAALLKDFKLIREIIQAVRRAVRVPLTVKTRAGWGPGEGEIKDLAPILADGGVDAVTLHPRYGIQGFGGKADWRIIAELVDCFPGPVIGNGDVTSPEHVLTMLKETGCAGVMIGRASLGNPWLFSQALALLEGRFQPPPDLDERLRLAGNHARLLGAYVGPGRAVFMLRSVLMWYARGLPGAASFRGSLNQVGDFNHLLKLVESYFVSLAEQEMKAAA
ncbi:MAG: tRNA dihydrouridine synthase DusB [Pseudomonadota bacterium]